MFISNARGNRLVSWSSKESPVGGTELVIAAHQYETKNIITLEDHDRSIMLPNVFKQLRDTTI